MADNAKFKEQVEVGDAPRRCPRTACANSDVRARAPLSQVIIGALKTMVEPVPPEKPRTLSLPKSVVEAGGVAAWNAAPELAVLDRTLDAACKATTVADALNEIKALMSLGHMLYAYAYLRRLSQRDSELYYSLLLADPGPLLPIAYTPTVGEACQKFGRMPQGARGCYVSITDRGNIAAVLQVTGAT